MDTPILGLPAGHPPTLSRGCQLDTPRTPPSKRCQLDALAGLALVHFPNTNNNLSPTVTILHFGISQNLLGEMGL